MVKIFSKLSLGIILVFSSSVLVAQDFHFAQYWSAPLKLNPALTGFYNGNLRVAATYRNQWLALQSFSTYAVSTDARFFQNKLNEDVLGLGLGFYQEIEGDGSFKNSAANLSFAFNKQIGKRNVKHFLGLGFDFSYYVKQLNLKNAVYGNFFETNINSDPLDGYKYAQTSFVDMALGLNYFLNANEIFQYNLGFSVDHILSPTVSFSANENDILYRKLSLNTNANIMLKKDLWHLIPLLMYQNQGPHHELLFGTYVQYVLNTRKNASVYLGAQLRMAANDNNSMNPDAIIVNLRAEYTRFDFGFAYDITLSSLRKSAALQGGPELYVMYILKSKNNLNKQMSSCPKF